MSLIKIHTDGAKLPTVDGGKHTLKMGQYVRRCKTGKVLVTDNKGKPLATLTEGSDTIAAKFGQTLIA